MELHEELIAVDRLQPRLGAERRVSDAQIGEDRVFRVREARLHEAEILRGVGPLLVFEELHPLVVVLLSRDRILDGLAAFLGSAAAGGGREAGTDEGQYDEVVLHDFSTRAARAGLSLCFASLRPIGDVFLRQRAPASRRRRPSSAKVSQCVNRRPSLVSSSSYPCDSTK